MSFIVIHQAVECNFFKDISTTAGIALNIPKSQVCVGRTASRGTRIELVLFGEFGFLRAPFCRERPV